MFKFLILFLFSFGVYANQSTDVATKITLTSRNHIVLDQEFNLATTTQVMVDINKLIYGDVQFPLSLESFNRPKEIYLIMNSPGGSIEAGLMMIDSLLALDVKVHTIVLFGASMGFITTQHLGTRYILRHGTLMSHLASGGFSGSFPRGNMNSRYDYFSRRLKQVDEQIVKRTNGIHTLESYRKLINQEYWCTGVGCITQGFADKIADVKCGKSLMGTRTELKNVSFMGMRFKAKIKKYNCPLLLNISVMKASINGRKYNFDNQQINQELYKRLSIRYER